MPPDAFYATQLDEYAKRVVEQQAEIERKKDYAERMDALAEERLSEIERLRAHIGILTEEGRREIERRDKQWREIVATVTAGNVALEAENKRLKTKRPDWWALIAENERLSQERDAESARYDAAMTTLAAVREELERALEIVDAARNLDEHRDAGYASVVSYMIRLHEALTAGRQPDPRPET